MLKMNILNNIIYIIIFFSFYIALCVTFIHSVFKMQKLLESYTVIKKIAQTQESIDILYDITHTIYSSPVTNLENKYMQT